MKTRRRRKLYPQLSRWEVEQRLRELENMLAFARATAQPITDQFEMVTDARGDTVRVRVPQRFIVRTS